MSTGVVGCDVDLSADGADVVDADEVNFSSVVRDEVVSEDGAIDDAAESVDVVADVESATVVGTLVVDSDVAVLADDVTNVDAAFESCIAANRTTSSTAILFGVIVARIADHC